MKAYTSIEQSKKLAEILPVETANMKYPYFGKGRYGTTPLFRKSIEFGGGKYVPCWSLAALLDILPKGTRLVKSAADNTYHCDCPKGNIDKWYDSSVDAALEMILKLHELNLL